jgi:hypothetical protein
MLWYLTDMDPIRRAGTVTRIVGLTLTAGLASITLTACHTTSGASPAPASKAPSSAGAASASPSLSIPGTHKSTTVYQISSPVSAVIVISHAGNVTVSGGAGSATSVTQQIAYSKTPPVTTRTVSGKTLTVSYSCPAQLVCGVAYIVQVPRSAAVQVTAGAGAIRLSGLAGNVTAKADVGLVSATGLTGSSVSLTTGVGGITAAFSATPTTVQALTRVGGITLRVPSGASYKVSAHTHLGKATISVPQSSSAAHTITATTDLGAIVVGPPA